MWLVLGLVLKVALLNVTDVLELVEDAVDAGVDAADLVEVPAVDVVVVQLTALLVVLQGVQPLAEDAADALVDVPVVRADVALLVRDLASQLAHRLKEDIW